MANSLILTKAQNAITSHDWGTAARLYKELLRGNEKNIEYLQQLGSIYVRAGQDEKAIPYYEEIIKLNPDSTDAMISLGGIFRRLKRYEDSVNILYKAQKISLSNPTISYNLGFTYKEMGNYDDAIDSFETVIEQNPNDVLAHNHLGSIYSAKKEYDKAISAYKRGLQVDQNHPILNYNLAHVYEEKRNFPDAVRCFEIALKTRPGWLDAIRDFSELLIKCQNTRQAQELVEQSIKLHPNDVDLLCILGRIYLNQFDYDNATKTFKRAENLKQNDINILVGLSKSLEKGMKIEQAMEKILDAVDIAPENIDVCKQYAHVLLSAQRYDKALGLIKTIDAKTNGKDLQVLDLYGQYFVCRGDEEAANTYFDKIKKLNHHYKDYMVNAADRYIQTGNYEKAEKMASNFIESRPQLADGYNLLGTINSARGELKKAKTEFEKGIGLKNPNIYAVKQLEKIYSELEANKEIFNDEEMPIAVDADQLSAEDGGNLSDDGNLIASDEETADQLDALNANGDKDEEDDSALHGLESTPPIEQALTGEEGDFWEDFDDDPNSENKPVPEEDDGYDENEEDSDLLSMMTPAAGDDDRDDLTDGLSEDEGEFNFSDFDDATAKEEPSDETAPIEESPEQSAPMEPASFEPAPVEPVTEQSLPASEPRPAPASYPSMSEDEAKRMMNDLKQQQKELELQQREMALQQKEFADELKQELKQQNEKMIHEAVGKAVNKAVDQAIDEAVDKAVDEKLQEYDLPEAGSSVQQKIVEPEIVEDPINAETTENIEEPEITVEPEMTEETGITDKPEFAADTEVTEATEITEEPDTAVEPETTVEPEIEEEPVITEVPEVVEDTEIIEEPVNTEETENSEEQEISEESEISEETEINDESENSEETVITEEPLISEEAEVSEETEISEEPVVEDSFDSVPAPVQTSDSDSNSASLDYTDYPFLSVDDILLMGGEKNVIDEEPADEKSVAAKAQTEDDDLFVTADDMLEKIERILNDDKTAAAYAQEIELFKKLKVLTEALPDSEKNTSTTCRMRMMIEYIIAKMSGKPGLLVTAESLIKSGVLGDEYKSQLNTESEEELCNDLIKRVIKGMKKLAAELEDKALANALCVTADGILEQIALVSQKSEIF